LLSGNWVENTAWGGGLGYSAVSNRAIEPLLLTDRVLGTTSLKGLFALDRGVGGLQSNFPDGGVPSDPGGPIATPDGFLFGDGLTSSPLLYSVTSTLGSGTSTPTSGSLVGTPLLGSDGVLYFATVGGTLDVRTSQSMVLWSNGFGSSESFLASPTI